ncbi:hypothetical protein H072_9266 [Dactylellina haptotyla CBS 200.50]|uniref:Autophagy-related protein n=1 Tax=Dactylellina haptotyla (strain CBS 200.50) TaxID=1284197 RepID=S8A290_DACHA|nr:hypothetical protein H072_9266 [Dactylellina haptotyla CBS 200.50]
MSRAADLLASKLPKPHKPLGQRLRERLPFATHIPLHASFTYLFAICLFSISFLVFLNSALSFVVTDLFDVQDGVGSIVGTLGFVDELIAVFMVIFWGALSDRIGTRLIAVSGYFLVGVSLVTVVQVKSIYPGLIFARILFSMGASATVVSVTAVLPEISTPLADSKNPSTGSASHHVRHHSYPGASDPSSSTANRDRASSSNRPGFAGSSSSKPTTSTLSIPPAPNRPLKWRPPSRSRSRQQAKEQAKLSPKPITGKLSGIVGFMTGCGALIALVFFLPLPAKFQDKHMTRTQALKHTFYVVACVAWIVSLAVLVGLRGANVGGKTWEFWKSGIFAKAVQIWNRKGKANDSLLSNSDEEAAPSSGSGATDIGSQQEGSSLFPDSSSIQSTGSSSSRTAGYDAIRRPTPPVQTSWKEKVNVYFGGLRLALKAGTEDWRIGLGYLGGFVARSMSVGISLFIPLYVNQWMRARGMCPPVLPSDPNYKKSCREAYILAAMLTGTSQLSALIFAPVVGYFSDRYGPQYPLLATAVLGFISCGAFSALQSLAVGADRSWAYLHCALMGIGQIGAIVASLALIGNAIQDDSLPPSLLQIGSNNPPAINETTPINPATMSLPTQTKSNRLAFKGSISGVYSLCGAVGILILTQLGGWGADHVNAGFAFDLLAVFFSIEIALGCWLIFRASSSNV